MTRPLKEASLCSPASTRPPDLHHALLELPRPRRASRRHLRPVRRAPPAPRLVPRPGRAGRRRVLSAVPVPAKAHRLRCPGPGRSRSRHTLGNSAGGGAHEPPHLVSAHRGGAGTQGVSCGAVFWQESTGCIISAPRLTNLDWGDEYNPISVHLGKMEHLRSLGTDYFLVYGDYAFIHNHFCLSLLQRVEGIQTLCLTLMYLRVSSHFSCCITWKQLCHLCTIPC